MQKGPAPLLRLKSFENTNAALDHSSIHLIDFMPTADLLEKHDRQRTAKVFPEFIQSAKHASIAATA